MLLDINNTIKISAIAITMYCTRTLIFPLLISRPPRINLITEDFPCDSESFIVYNHKSFNMNAGGGTCIHILFKKEAIYFKL